jgi:hypothetical protein
MAYYLVRLYSGSGDRPMEQLIQETVVNDLVPKLQEGGGLQRYLAVITDDGRTGSASLYESKKAADRGLQIAREWVQNTGAMRGYQLTSAFGGQVIRQRHGEAHGQRVTHGVARLYSTNATAEQVADAIEQYGDPAVDAIQGRARTLITQLDDGRVGIFAGFTSQESRDKHSQAVRQHRASVEAMKAALPSEPQEINTRVIAERSF